jgi:hypothetical protein
MADPLSGRSSSESADYVGVVFACRGAFLVISTPRSFSKPHWWPPTLDRRREEDATEVVDRVREMVGAPANSRLHPLGATAYVNDDGVRGECALFVQPVRDRWQPPTYLPGVLWRPLVGGPECPGVDALIVQALTGNEPNLGLVIHARNLFSAENLDDSSALQRATHPDPAWRAELLARRQRRDAFVADMPVTKSCDSGELDAGERRRR